MSFLSTIMSKVFGNSHPAVAAVSASAPAPATPTTVPVEAAAIAPEAPATPVVTATPPPVVDVTAILDDLADKNSEHLDWKKSIVDLMKLLGLDSSLADRKELAKELHYTGDTSDSATMNVWLHKEVIRKFAENGGKVPADLL